jgi:hypothetical protein
LGSLELGGPVVVAALVIAGFFYLQHLQRPFSVRVHVQSDSKEDYLSDLFSESKLETSLDGYPSLKIDRGSDSFIWNIPPNWRGKKIKITARVPGFSQMNPDPKEEVPLPARGTINVVLKPAPHDESTITPSQAVKEIADALQTHDVKLNDTEKDTLEYVLAQAINLVHPNWTDWEEGEPGGLKSKITMVQIHEPPKHCRGAEWEVQKSGSSAAVFAKACHHGDLHWEFEVEPLDKPQSECTGNGKSQSVSSVPDVVYLKFVNHTNHQVDVFSIDDKGKPIRHASIFHGGSKHVVQTYAGRSWAARTADGKELALKTDHEKNSSYVANKGYAEVDIVNE